MMWARALGLALLGMAVSANAQERGAFRESSGLQVQSGTARMTLDLDDVPLRDALKTLAARGGVPLVYAASALPLDKHVTVHVRDASVRDALREALRGTNTDVREAPNGQLMLVKRVEREEAILPPELAPGSITGRVTDSASGVSVIRAVVSMDGSAKRATTDDDGRYRLNEVAAGAHTIAVRRIGYAPAERLVMVPDAGSTVADFALAAVASRLNEVVTTVTGPQRRLEIANVIGRIDADSVVREAPVATLSDLLNARVPGTQIVLNGGMTGDSPRIRIRGINSFSVRNDPLLVVDGVRVENTTSEQVIIGGSLYGQTAGRLNDLDPDEIESIEIIKGPSAAALYGTDAANGVISVRTKRGRQGSPQWSVRAEYGTVTEPRRFPDNYYSWGHSTTTGATQQCLLAQSAQKQCVIDSLTTFNPLLDPSTSPLATGNRMQYGASVSGGAQSFTYFLSGEHQAETGFLEMPLADQLRIAPERGPSGIPDDQLHPNALSETSLRANVGTSFGSKAEVRLSTGLVSRSSRIPSNAVFDGALDGPGFRDARDGWGAGGGTRPGEAFAVRNAESASHLTAALTATATPLTWLSARATTGVDLSNNLLDVLQRRGEGPFGARRNGSRLTSRTVVPQYTADLGASAELAPTSRLTSRTSLGVQYNHRLVQTTTAAGTNLLPGAETVAGAAVLSGAEQTVESVVAGAYVEQLLGIDGRLFLTGGLRADGASAFGKNFHTAFYPKLGASWLAVEQSPRLLNSARLRVAYGASGVQPGATSAIALMSLSPALVDGANITGARLSAVGNPDLRPERQSEVEVGLDVEVLQHRLRIEATYYSRMSHDALVSRPLASEVGIASRQENIGSVSNRGVESLVSATLLDNSLLAWNLTLNGSVNRNRLERIGAGIPFVGNTTSRNVEGYPLFSRFARPILGFVDADGDGVIQESEVRVGDSLAYAGQSLPPRQLTTATSLSLLGGRVRIATEFDYRGGNSQINFAEINRCIGSNNCRALNDPSASLEDQARAVALNSTTYGNTFSGYMEDASFVRWRELSLTYAMPDGFAHRLRARTGSVTVSGRNLRLFTNYTGPDPEANDSPGRATVEGYSGNPTAIPAHYWTLRVNLGF
jgi:TonB-linked SusC/RagA family outer membrane protein